MRFFSNDAREANEELALDDRPERVQSDPVAVPNQRPPSPWSNTPTTPGDDIDDDDDNRESTDDEPRDATAAGTVTDDDTTGSQEPTTAFAAPARGDGRWDAADDTNVPYAGSPAGTDSRESWDQDEDGADAQHRRGPADDVDVPLDEPAAGDAALDAEAAPADAEKISEPDDAARADSESDDDDDDSDDEPEAVETITDEASPESDDDDDPDADELDAVAAAPVTDAPLAAADDTPATDEPAAGSAVVAAVPVPVGAAATAPAARTETIFGADDAQSFQDRWREVQLRFVDSPKDAAAEATTLIDEAVERLTAGLKAQRDGLADDTEDTERLRLQLRGYRDILNRILSL
ncbi:hypothetical protein [Actinoplanes sp. NPDC026623]|uniref:hypothetical protein n=1 Tax=Actinoplanes sp. NPDC026623 TaxID=3155610 RepID=UPI0033E0CE80